MAESSRASLRRNRLRELVVPALMIGGVGFYAYDSMHLSAEALILPAALIAVMLGASLWALASAFLGHAAARAAGAMGEGEDETIGPVLDRKPWLLVGVPVLMIAWLDQMGAFVALAGVTFGAQLALGAKSPLRSLLIAVAVTAPTYALFKYVLYVRFPAGVPGLG